MCFFAIRSALYFTYLAFMKIRIGTYLLFAALLLALIQIPSCASRRCDCPRWDGHRAPHH